MLVNKSDTRGTVIKRTAGGWTWHSGSKQEAEVNSDFIYGTDYGAVPESLIWRSLILASVFCPRD